MKFASSRESPAPNGEFGALHDASEVHARACELFDEVRRMPSSSRSAWLDSHATGQALVRAEVESLLAAHDAAGEFLADAAFDLARSATGLSSAPAELDGFRLIAPLGRGGMSAVYLAEQREPRRAVALKVLLPGCASPQRAINEARALARLQHPNIAQIYAAGSANWGRVRVPYLAMEWIRGVPLVAAANERGLDVRGRLQWMSKIARAVHYAHEHEVIHRDLKPSNILVDEAGAPKVLDFGIARLLGAASEGDGTRTGDLLGTPSYASPEQLSGHAHEADARTDVYALGALTFELVSGRRARLDAELRDQDAARAGWSDPPLLGALDRRWRGDLEAIVAQALASEPARRYASALLFAEDLDRFLNDEPVRAKREGLLASAARLVRRHRILCGGIATTFVALLAGVATTWHQARVAARERSDAVEARFRAENEARRAKSMFAAARQSKDQLQATHDFLKSMLASVDADELGRDARISDVLARASDRLQSSFNDSPEVAASLAWTLGDAYRDLGLEFEAEAHFRRAHELLLLSRGEADADTIRCGIAVAQLAMERGDLELADGLIRRALELALLPEVSCEYDARRAVKEFAKLLDERGEFDEAARLLDEAIESSRREQRLDATAVRLLLERADLAYRQFEFERALELNREALDLQSAIGLDEYKLTMRSLLALSGALRKTGRVQEALEIQREVLANSVRTLGEEHVDVIAARNNYALTLGDAGRCEESIDELGRVLEVARTRWGVGHVHTLSVLNNMADRCLLAGQRERAHGLYREFVRGARESSYSAHPTLILIRNTIVLFLGEHGHFEEGLELSDELIALGADTFEADVAANAYFYGRMGFMLLKLGRHDDALQLLEPCVEALASVHGPDAPEDLAWRRYLAEARAACEEQVATVSMVTR